MKRYVCTFWRETENPKAIGYDVGVRIVDAQAALDAKDQTIADLKALLYRAADIVERDGHTAESPALLAEISAALR